MTTTMYFALITQKQVASVWPHIVFRSQTISLASLAYPHFLYRVLILSQNYRLSPPTATLPRVREVGWVGYVNTTNKPTGTIKRYLPDKIMILPLSCKWRDFVNVSHLRLHVKCPSFLSEFNQT